jgi:glutamate-5-semialdehyde dehydrogenase
MIPQSTSSQSVIESAHRAKIASAQLAQTSIEDRNRALERVLNAIKNNAETIITANDQDLESARQLVEKGQLSEAHYQRLKLDDTKLREMVAGIQQVASLEDPLGRVTYAIELDEGLRLYRVTCPIGVVGVIFESRPDALVQISSLCLKSGNGVLLKGGQEAEKTNRALFEIIRSAINESGLPSDAMVLLESREDVTSLLKAEGLVDLIIPRGSNELVRYVQENTNIPVLGHAEGLCHVYVDRAADLKKARDIVIDAKIQYPAACNAVETLLVHREAAPDFLRDTIQALRRSDVEVRCDEETFRLVGDTGIKLADEQDWRTEYCELIVSIKVVSSIDEAIRHINTYGSRHTETIVSEDKNAFDRFFAEVDAAGVFWNASTRFADGYRYGFGAEVGISTSNLHPRGPVGLEGLVTYKYKLVGDGHTVGMYSDQSTKRFTHKPLKDDAQSS